MENESAHLVVTHHGIRTVESWQARFELALRKGAQARGGQAPTVWAAENGYFSILSYALPFLRMRAVEEFERNLATVLRERQWERVDFVAHSFGTYIVANALMRIAASEPGLLKPLRVVITSGSVLPCRFGWHSLVRHAPDLRVINDVAHDDWALVFNPLNPLNLTDPLGVGLGGRYGFHKLAPGPYLTNRFFPGGHTACLREAHINAYWVEPILSRNEIEPEGGAAEGVLRRLERSILDENGAWVSAAIAFASVAAIALGADWGLGQARSAGARTAGAMAELARAANENGQYERAARFAIAGLRGHDTPLLGFAPNAAYAELARAALASRLNASTQMHVGGLTHPALSPDGRLFVTADLSYFLQLWDAGTGALVAPLHNHNSYLTTVIFSPDGRRVLSASYDGTARVWDLSTGDVIVHLEDDMGVVYDAVFSSDGATILTASGDATARLWDAQTGREIRRFVGHRHELMSARFDRAGARIVTAAADNTARIWDVASGRQIGELTGAQGVDAWHTGAVHDGRATFMMAIFSPDGSRVLTTARDNTASLWDAASGRELLRLRGHDDFISGAAFSADGEKIVTAGRSDTTVRVWDARSGASMVLRGHSDSVGGAFFCAADRVLSWSNDGGARLWDTTSGHVVAEFDDAGGAIHGAVANQDCTRVVTAGQSGVARVWDARAFPPHLTLSGHGGGVDEAWFSPDGARAVTFSSEGDGMMMWDALTGRQLYVVSDISRGQNDVRWSPDGATLATTSVDGSLRFLASATGREIRTIAAGASVACATFDATGALLAACLDDGSVKVWRVSDGVELFHLPGNERGTNSIAFSPDGQLIAAAASDHITRVWSLASGRETAQLFHDNVVRRVVFSADGSRILTAVQDGTARIWTRSGRPQHVLEGHDDRVGVAVFSPDDRRVLTASDNGRAFVWDAASGERLAALEGHTWAVTSGQFSPDGRFVATASYDQSSRVWEVATGRLVAMLDRDHGPIYGATFSSDGGRVITPASDRMARIWDLPALRLSPRALIASSCAGFLASRSELSDAEVAMAAPSLDLRGRRDVCA